MIALLMKREREPAEQVTQLSGHINEAASMRQKAQFLTTEAKKCTADNTFLSNSYLAHLARALIVLRQGDTCTTKLEP